MSRLIFLSPIDAVVLVRIYLPQLFIRVEISFVKNNRPDLPWKHIFMFRFNLSPGSGKESVMTG
jgi:hypothetical protein